MPQYFKVLSIYLKKKQQYFFKILRTNYFQEHGYITTSIGKIFHPMGHKMGNNPDDFQKSWTDWPFFVKPQVNYLSIKTYFEFEYGSV